MVLESLVSSTFFSVLRCLEVVLYFDVSVVLLVDLITGIGRVPLEYFWDLLSNVLVAFPTGFGVFCLNLDSYDIN